MKKTVSMFVLCVLLMALCVPALANSNGVGASPEDIAVFNAPGSANRGLQDRAVTKLGAEKAAEFMDNKVAHAQFGGYAVVTLPFVVGPDDDIDVDVFDDYISVRVTWGVSTGNSGGSSDYSDYYITYRYDARHTGNAEIHYVISDLDTYKEIADIAPGDTGTEVKSKSKLGPNTNEAKIELRDANGNVLATFLIQRPQQ